MPPPSAASHDRLAEEICEIGRRLYAKGFVAGHDGNISCRLGPDRVLCTPTMVSKGFMAPADLCVVDIEGRQVAGERRCSSEILLHVTIMRERPDVMAVVHCHPPHATAFAVAREPLPRGVLPEAEMVLGRVPIADYATPGTQAFADTVKPCLGDSSVVMLANHGTVSFGASVERACWLTEILDATCRTVMSARSLGRVVTLTEAEIAALERRWKETAPWSDGGEPPRGAAAAHDRPSSRRS